MNLLGSYINGNYRVYIFDDGTKIRVNRLATLEPDFPESIDIKISNRCDMGCAMCHEQSTPYGDLAELDHPILNTLPAYTELAIGGGNVLEHPDLGDFLKRMKEREVICNMTVNIHHFVKEYDRLLELSRRGLIHGLGISVNEPLETIPHGFQRNLADVIADFPNAVVHVIAGIVSPETLVSMSNKNIKLLILGYKTFGRGVAFHESHPGIDAAIKALSDALPELKKHFALLSFDNLALKQLDVRSIVSQHDWERGYMGDDGQFTMYIDLVKNEYAVSSTSPRHPLVQTDIREVFRDVRELARKGRVDNVD